MECLMSLFCFAQALFFDRGKGVGGAGVGAVPLDILAAHFLILFDTDLWAQRGISGP
jgi:hypothetical protein